MHTNINYFNYLLSDYCTHNGVNFILCCLIFSNGRPRSDRRDRGDRQHQRRWKRKHQRNRRRLFCRERQIHHRQFLEDHAEWHLEQRGLQRMWREPGNAERRIGSSGTTIAWPVTGFSSGMTCTLNVSSVTDGVNNPDDPSDPNLSMTVNFQ